MLETILRFARPLIPTRIFLALQPAYHYILSFAGAVFYRFPARHLHVVAVTGTKGKTTVSELVAHILSSAGHTVAVSNTYRFAIAGKETRNRYKMTMPGRFFMQRFLRDALDAHCTHAVVEMTSEGVRLNRHAFIGLNALIVTNIAPEHIESHGSFARYLEAKLSLARTLARSRKFSPVILINRDDKALKPFFDVPVRSKKTFGLSDADNVVYTARRTVFSIENVPFSVPIEGAFNANNALAAIAYARTLGIPLPDIASALAAFPGVRGRVEHIDEGQSFDVVVDYAHTPESLMALYEAFADRTLVCVLGNTGGGRDVWKRPVMAEIADVHCAHVILTNEDPYDEDPKKIMDDMAVALKKPHEQVLDRRAAITRAIEFAASHTNSHIDRVAVLITGKGTDPYIMGARGAKEPWDDAAVAREELTNLLRRRV